MEANKELYHLYHNDFRLLNGKLLEYYGFTDELRKMLGYIPSIFDLEEVKSKDVEQLIPYVLGDMEFDKEVINEKPNVFTFDQIVGYIETSVDAGLLNIKQAAIRYRLPCFLQVENAQFCSEKCQGILPAKFSLQRNTFHRLLEAETLAGE